MSGLHHGGNLREAARRWGIAEQDWLDLSTGISPWPWPVPQALPADVFQRLPYASASLLEAAHDYYGARHALAVAGSQPAIQTLPTLRAPCRVALPDIGYSEHAEAWRRAGHSLLHYRHDTDLEDWLSAHPCDVLVVINPNNPTGHRHPPAPLLRCHQRLAAQDGWLVVDEAFGDALPDLSLAGHSHEPGLIVLRSLGKFFALAGLRLGFVLAAPDTLRALDERLGPWTITGPSQWLGERALRDQAWQADMRQRLPVAGQQQQRWLSERLAPLHSQSTPLFCSLGFRPARAQQLHEQLATQGILTRVFPEQGLLRFGLCTAASQARLAQALGSIKTA